MHRDELAVLAAQLRQVLKCIIDTFKIIHLSYTYHTEKLSQPKLGRPARGEHLVFGGLVFAGLDPG